MSVSEWLSLLGAMATIFAACVAAWVTHRIGTSQSEIARQQADTAKSKLKLDLFDRRLEVYDSVMTVIVHVLQSGDYSASDERSFLLGIHGARWIFDKETHSYLNGELRDDLNNLHLAVENLKTAGEERQKFAQIKAEAFAKVRKHFNEIDEVFAPALQLES